MKTPRRPSTEKRLHRLIGLALILSAALPAAASDIATDVVISEVLPYPADGQAAFIELYNPTSQDVNLGAYALSTDDSRSPQALTGYIPAYGFYLVALAEEGWPAGWPAADFILPELKLAPLTSGLRLSRGEGEEPDMLGWGVAPFYWEGTPCNTPSAGESLERKSGSSHDEGAGNGYDTDNNIFDFRLRPEPEPQNTYSDIERPPSTADGLTWGFIKDLFGTQR